MLIQPNAKIFRSSADIGGMSFDAGSAFGSDAADGLNAFGSNGGWALVGHAYLDLQVMVPRSGGLGVENAPLTNT